MVIEGKLLLLRLLRRISSGEGDGNFGNQDKNKMGMWQNTKFQGTLHIPEITW